MASQVRQPAGGYQSNSLSRQGHPTKAHRFNGGKEDSPSAKPRQGRQTLRERLAADDSVVPDGTKSVRDWTSQLAKQQPTQVIRNLRRTKTNRGLVVRRHGEKQSGKVTLLMVIPRVASMHCSARVISGVPTHLNSYPSFTREMSGRNLFLTTSP